LCSFIVDLQKNGVASANAIPLAHTFRERFTGVPQGTENDENDAVGKIWLDLHG
jgi:hypothetical protein